MFYVVTYDIPDTPRRTRLAKALKDFGERVQLSVFECILDDRLFERMVDRIRETIELEDDRVRVYQVCEGCRKEVRILGQGMLTEDPEVYIV
jgi:CRISPR-associated protein Cas2